MAFTTSVVGSRSRDYMRKIRQTRYLQEKQEFLQEAKSRVEKFSPESVGYIAGLIDGEGTISFSFQSGARKLKSLTITSSTMRPYIEIGNTNSECLEFVKNRLGFGKIRMKLPRKSDWSASWTYGVHDLRQVATLLSLVMQYLIIKKRVADLVYEYCLSRLFTVHPRPPFANKWYSDREIEIAKEVKALQQK